MASETYIFTYKCRICGAEINGGFSGRATALRMANQTVCELEKSVNHPGNMIIHIANDHLGIADLIGCKIEGGAE